MESADSISEHFPDLKFLLELFFNGNFWPTRKRTYWFLTEHKQGIKELQFKGIKGMKAHENTFPI